MAREQFSPRTRRSCNACQNKDFRGVKTASETRRRRALRKEVIAAYGGRCACCGEGELIFLAMDHVAGGGNQHRRELAGKDVFYRWLKRNGFPNGFQVLCFNCNWAKSHGGCPHGTPAGQPQVRP